VNPEKKETKPFDPRDPAYRRKLWVHLDSHEGDFRHFFWGRIGAVLAVVLLAGWLTVAAGVWANVKYRRGFPAARYLDLAAPWRWGRYRSAISAHYLATGRLGLEHGYASAALNFFNASLAMDPGNLESRRLAALAQDRLGFKTAALALLQPGLARAADAGDDAYLRLFFDTAFALQADDDAFTTGRRLLPPRPDGSRTHRIIAFEIATARYNRGHYLEAQQILADWRLQDAPEGEVLLALCDAERGLPQKALGRLEGDVRRFTQRDGIYVAIERLAHDQGLPETVREYALLRELADPSRPQARIDLIYADHAMHLSAEVRQEVDSYCADFRSDPGALKVLSQFAADAGEPDTAQRARDLARARGIPTADFDVRVAQASFAARDYRRAVRAIAVAQTEIPPEDHAYETLLAGMKAVALFGAGDGGAELAYSDFFPRAGALAPIAGLYLADELRGMGLAEKSRQLLERVSAETPDDQPLLAALIRGDAAAGNRTGLVTNLPRLLKMRKPPRDALDASLRCLDPTRDAALRTTVTKALAGSPAAALPDSD